MPIEKGEIIIYLVCLTIVFFIVFAFVFSFFILYNKRQIINQLEKKDLLLRHEQEILKATIEIQEQTLKTISQEIHDNVGQVLSLAKLNLNTFKSVNMVQETKIVSTKNLVAKAIVDLRNISRSLHGDRVAEVGLKQSILDELSTLESTGQFLAECVTSGTVFKLDMQVEVILFRIFQEALNNAIKYSKASRIRIDLTYLPKQFLLSIKDDGLGFDLAALQTRDLGVGLRSMQNRAAMIGGLLTIHSVSGAGTEIFFKLETERK